MSTLFIICFFAGGIGAMLQEMLGIGTGIVVVPLLTYLLPMYGIEKDLAIHIAIATSMTSIATNSISALISHYYRGNVKWQIFQKIIFFSVLGSCLGAITASFISGRVLQCIFGGFLLLTSIYMLIKKEHADITDNTPMPSLRKTATGGFTIGLIASIVGSGGGILMVPFLTSLKLKMRYAIGTSILIGFPVSIMGACTYIFIGLTKIPSTPSTIGYLHWPAFLAITSAGIMFAPIGVKLSSVIPTKVLQIFFAGLMILIGGKMLMHV